MTEPTFPLTKLALYDAFLRWELRARDGRVRNREAANKLPAEEIARQNTEHLWQDLTAVAGGVAAPTTVY